MAHPALATDTPKVTGAKVQGKIHTSERDAKLILSQLLKAERLEAIYSRLIADAEEGDHKARELLFKAMRLLDSEGESILDILQALQAGESTQSLVDDHIPNPVAGKR